MNIRFILTLTLMIFTLGCEAKTKNIAPEQNSSLTTKSSLNVESTSNTFSAALTNKDISAFLTIADPHGIYLVRLFTSGNLGGRGSSLSELQAIVKIDKALAFPIKKQTPFDLPGLFINLPIKSFKALPSRKLLPEIDNTHYDQWAPILKKSLSGAPEAVTGDPIILSSGSSKYWVYAEAQIIDDMLVGGFAVFENQNGKLMLVAVIELL